MKAVIETTEPVIRPITIHPVATSAPRRSVAQFVPVRADATLFHAWRA